KLQAKNDLFSAIADYFGTGESNARTAAQIIEAAGPPTTGPAILAASPVNEGKRKALRAALMTVAPSGKEINPRGLGIWLRGAKQQIVSGMRLCSGLDRKSTATWWIERCE